MHRTISISGTEYIADAGILENYRVTIKGGEIFVSPDLDTVTPGAEFEAVVYGRERINMISAREEEDCEIGPISEPTLEDVKAAKLAEIAAARWREEVGGTAVNGMAIDTSRESQALVTGATLQATIDPEYTCRWKTAAGFVELDAAAILAVAVAVRTHVQACFDKEANLAGLVNEAETVEAVREIGWS